MRYTRLTNNTLIKDLCEVKHEPYTKKGYAYTPETNRVVIQRDVLTKTALQDLEKNLRGTDLIEFSDKTVTVNLTVIDNVPFDFKPQTKKIAHAFVDKFFEGVDIEFAMDFGMTDNIVQDLYDVIEVRTHCKKRIDSKCLLAQLIYKGEYSTYNKREVLDTSIIDRYRIEDYTLVVTRFKKEATFKCLKKLGQTWVTKELLTNSLRKHIREMLEDYTRVHKEVKNNRIMQEKLYVVSYSSITLSGAAHDQLSRLVEPLFLDKLRNTIGKMSYEELLAAYPHPQFKNS